MSQSIDPKDIKVGDRIRVFVPQGETASITYEDIVKIHTGTYIETETSYFFTRDNDAEYKRTYELVERPTPVEPTKTGTIVKTDDGRTYIRVPLDVRPDAEFPWVIFTGQFHVDASSWTHLLNWGITEVIEP